MAVSCSNNRKKYLAVIQSKWIRTPCPPKQCKPIPNSRWCARIFENISRQLSLAFLLFYFILLLLFILFFLTKKLLLFRGTHHVFGYFRRILNLGKIWHTICVCLQHGTKNGFHENSLVQSTVSYEINCGYATCQVKHLHFKIWPIRSFYRIVFISRTFASWEILYNRKIWSWSLTFVLVSLTDHFQKKMSSSCSTSYQSSLIRTHEN